MVPAGGIERYAPTDNTQLIEKVRTQEPLNPLYARLLCTKSCTKNLKARVRRRPLNAGLRSSPSHISSRRQRFVRQVHATRVGPRGMRLYGTASKSRCGLGIRSLRSKASYGKIGMTLTLPGFKFVIAVLLTTGLG